MSLRASGDRLDKTLAELLGPATTPWQTYAHRPAALCEPGIGPELVRCAANSLAELPTGLQTFAGVPFRIDEKVIQLGNKETDTSRSSSTASR